MKKVVSISALWLSIGAGTPAAAQQPSIETRQQQVEEWLQVQPDSATELLAEIAEEAIQAKDWQLQAWVAKRRGTLFMYLADHERAISHYLEARDIYERLKDTLGLAGTYMNFGNVAGSMDDQIRNYRRSMELFRRTGGSAGIMKNLVNIGSVYLDHNHLDSAEHYFRKAYEMATKKNYTEVLKSSLLNLGIVYGSQGSTAAGIATLKKAISLYEESDEVIGLVYGYYHIGQFFYREGELDSCVAYVNRALQESRGNLPKIEVYCFELMYGAALQREAYQKAYRCLVARDSISNYINAAGNRELLKRMKAEYEVKAKEVKIQELQAAVTEDSYMRILYISILGMIVAFAAYLIFSQKDKSRKEKLLFEQERNYDSLRQKLLENDLENTRLEQQQLEDKLKLHKKNLAEFALNFVQNDEILKDIKSSLTNARRKAESKREREQLEELTAWLRKTQEKDRNRDVFLKKSEELTDRFLSDLMTKLPQLSQGDIRLLILIMLKLSYKEIAVIFNVKPQSVVMRRYHLRKKLGLQKGESFEFFIRKKLYG